MSEMTRPNCPECAEQPETVDRRDFIRVVGGSAAGIVAASSLASTPHVLANQPAAAARAPRPAEALIRELYASLNNDQRRQVVRAWDQPHGSIRNYLARHGMYNAPLGRRIGEVYTPAQRELCQRILRSICSDDAGYRCITRNGTFDNSRSFEACGADIFGEPVDGRPFAWVFTGHHLTVRCDGNSQPNAAFGGPMYYGHSPDGYSQRNVFYYQTQAVRSLFDALTPAQRRVAVVNGNPGEHENSVQFREQGYPGLPSSELTQAQRQLAETVMRTILNPYRREDADEVMEIIRRNGGLERIHFAFYRDRNANDDARWHFWRLEGPGFVWNYRILPHVHCYVNISARA
jgi:hypothetical protein